MATLKATIKKEKIRADKTWNVLIRFSHNGQSRYISTTMYVEKKDLTTSMKIKNQSIIDRCNLLIKEYREKINELNLEINDFDIDTIVDYLKSKNDKSGIDFVAFSYEWMRRNANLKGIKNYQSAINSLCKYFGKDKIYCDEITAKSLKDYEESLSGTKRAQSLYTNSIVRLFNEARYFYNDEDRNIIKITHNLSKFKPKRQNISEKRSLPEQIIKQIFQLEYDNKTSCGYSSRRDLALDCFKLSFCLMGINSADLYNADEYDGEYITYYRTKTKDRRADKAKMVIKVHPFIKPLIDKYRGDKKVFSFHERFSSHEGLNRSINLGIQEIKEELGISDITFYSARHSFATIAVNDVGINKYLVNDMLCHTDPSMRVTDIYIRKDFTPINEANFRLIEYLFKDLLNR